MNELQVPQSQLAGTDRQPDQIGRLIAKYGERVPRYTSYPTAPNFKTDITADTYASWLAQLDAAVPVSGYIHIPFCRSLCWYCGCNMSVARSNRPITDYVDWLIEEIKLVRLHVGQRLTFGALHFGGGTPNALPPRDLVRVSSALGQSFDIASNAEIAAEIDPRVLTAEWIEAAVDAGLNRVSLGIQDFDARVQRAVNRIQPFERTAWSVEAFRKAGIASINMDLIYGLPFQTTASVAHTVREVVTLAPDRIALFGYAHVPWMKPAQQLLPEQALPGPRERFDQQDIAARLLVDAGYVRIGLDHFARAGDVLAGGHVRRNFQGYTGDVHTTLLGFGSSSIGQLPQGYVQNCSKTPEWRRKLSDGELPVARGVALSNDDRFRAEVISRLMCDLAVDIAELATHFGFRPDGLASDFVKLKAMELEGIVRIDGESIVVTELGRPFVRSICATFDKYLASTGGRHSQGV
jgi:oxygen-independent coproporphyrinogen III oxidase